MVSLIDFSVFRPLLLVSASLALTMPAVAQSNTVSLGQIGTTNTIGVTQTGADNLVGAERLFLRLNQIGSANTVSIDQFGNRNTVGSLDPLNGEPVPLDFEEATGLNQLGDHNALSVSQSTGRNGGWNTVGVVLQQAASGYAGVERSNDLSIAQWGSVPFARRREAVESASEHFIGQIVQRNPTLSGATNIALLSQGGGGHGLGHRLNSLLQSGSGNSLVLTQIDIAQQGRNIFQSGTGNSIQIEQRDGAGNRLDDIRQQGTSNRIRLEQSGAENLVAEIFQDNASFQSGPQRLLVGNMLSLSVDGNRNGGEAVGGLTSFSDLAEAVGVVQSSLHQVGDGNTLSYTISGERGASSDRNLYGFSQDGFSNGLSGVVVGDDNQAAIRQQGDGNLVDFSQAGNGNAASIAIVGDLNETRITRSVLVSARLLDTPFYSGVAQKGDRNALSVNINGRGNAIDVFQNGNANFLMMAIVGTDNAGMIRQQGDSNIATLTQLGMGNVAFVSQ